MADKFDIDRITDVMANFLALSVSRMQRNLAASRSNNSGELRQSLSEAKSTGLIVKDGVVTLKIAVAPHGPFVDEGIQGKGGTSDVNLPWLKGKKFSSQNTTSSFKYKNKKPPFKEILKWVQTKTMVNPNMSDKLRAITIQETVYRKGTKPTNFISDVINDKSVGKLIERLTDAGVESVIAEMGNIATRANKK